MAIMLTEKAAGEVKRIMGEQKAAGVADQLYLRMTIKGGGCSGFQPKLDLDQNANPKTDEIFEVHGVQVAVDKRSMLYMSEAVVDFHDDLNRRGFSFDIPSAKSKCGCGSSFSM